MATPADIAEAYRKLVESAREWGVDEVIINDLEDRVAQWQEIADWEEDLERDREVLLEQEDLRHGNG